MSSCSRKIVETNAERTAQYRKRVDEMSIMDDAFMTVALDDNTTLGEILSIILDRKINVISVESQVTVSNLEGRGVRLDILGEDEERKFYNLEVQRGKDGAYPARLVLNAGAALLHCTPKGVDYSDIPEVYVILIYQGDYFGDGLPVYNFEFELKASNVEENINFHVHLYYVNGAYEGANTKIEQLVHDLSCPNPDKIHNEVIAARVKTVKTVESEVIKVYRNLDKEYQEGWNDGRDEERLANIRSLMKRKGFELEETLDILGIPKKEWDRYRSLLDTK